MGFQSAAWPAGALRTIVSAEGETSVRYWFEAVPEAQPETWFDNGQPINWGVGHLGYGVFLTRETNTSTEPGPDDPPYQPGISYFAGATEVHLFQACDGDTNGDGNLDGNDIQRILSELKFNSGEPADWTQGDFDGDNDCDGDDIQLILATGLWPTMDYDTIPVVAPPEGSVDLIVDPATGMVQISADELTLSGYVIESAAGVFTGQPAENLGLFVEDTDTRISGNLDLALSGMHDLGAVIGSQWNVLIEEDLTFTYTIAGSPGIHAGTLVVIPEPGTLVLLALGALCVLGYRWRTRTRLARR